MVRRLNNKSTYRVRGDLGTYAVTMERLNNDVNGNPRWGAQITRVDNLINYDATWTICHTFTGHHYNEQDEAGWIVRHFEREEQDNA